MASESALQPLVCMDETSNQLLREPRPEQPAAPGHPRHGDAASARDGVANLFLFCEPLAGRRWVAVTERRTRTDWAEQIKDLVDRRYPEAERIVLVMDNLNTHSPASLYEAFAPAEATRLADKLAIHHPPKHGRWPNMAEIELSALSRQAGTGGCRISLHCKRRSRPGKRIVTGSAPGSISASPRTTRVANSRASTLHFRCNRVLGRFSGPVRAVRVGAYPLGSTNCACRVASPRQPAVKLADGTGVANEPLRASKVKSALPLAGMAILCRNGPRPKRQAAP